MRALFILIILFWGFTCLGQQAPTLSANAEISLLTCSPGEQVFEAFGHTAIRVKDEANGIDHTFNYGTFNFNQPNFYGNFVKGRLLYMLGVSTTKGFTNYYRRHNRQITEQILNLSEAEKQNLFNALDENAKPENKEYLYDYYYDNCSTRPRDVIVAALDGELKFDSSDCSNRSIRQLQDDHLDEDRAWGRLGINICLSSAKLDGPATAWEYLYLPNELLSAFDKMTVVTDSSTHKLVKEKRILVEMIPTDIIIPVTRPRNVFVALLLIVASIVTGFRIRKKSVRLLEGALFFFFGLLSFLFLFLWFGTDHYTARPAYSLLWAVPTHLIFGVVLFFKNRPAWVRWYALLTSLLIAGILIGWNYLPYTFPYEIRFLILLQLFLAVGIIKGSAKKPTPSA
jgi:hypothetical protein